jgi:hypothetical protein
MIGLRSAALAVVGGRAPLEAARVIAGDALVAAQFRRGCTRGPADSLPVDLDDHLIDAERFAA